jgi:hypothetical protein
MEITTMLNITRKLVLLAMCGASLAAGSNASQASNVYNAAPSQVDAAGSTEPQPRHWFWACPTEYWACPTEALTIFAKADDQGTRTDATVSDMPEHTWSLEDWSRYYDYGPFTLGD